MNKPVIHSSFGNTPPCIGDYRVKIDEALSTELFRYKESVFYTPLTEALKGGKRLRPVLLLLSFECVDGRGLDPLPAAVVMELAHTGSLIHDDMIDKDSVRRNSTTFHVCHGNPMAILITDFILSIILDITGRCKEPKILRELAVAVSRMCEGELEELKAYSHHRKLSMSEYIHIISKKTASLFEASARTGAVIGGAGEDDVWAISRYGRLLGIAYQIEDDLSDLREDAPSILSLLDAGSEGSEPLHELSRSYARRAKRVINRLIGSRAKDLLIELSDFITPST